MHVRSTFLFGVLFSIIFIAGCGGSGENTSNTTNGNAAGDNPLETTKMDPELSTNEAPTLTPVVKAYCEAKMKKDEASLRKVFSQGTIKSFEEQMKSDNIKTLVAFLEDEQVSEGLCAAKNEKITGDTAVAKIYIDSYPNGIDIYFEKENGEWKMTNKSPTFEAVKQSNSNSNSASPANSTANTSK